MVRKLEDLSERDLGRVAGLDRDDVSTDPDLGEPDRKGYEQVDGVWVEKPVSNATGIVGGNVFGAVRDFVRPRRLGYVFVSEGGYRMLPDSPKTMQKPDVSFVAAARVTAEVHRKTWWPIAPDLAVEVISPTELTEESETKLDEYLRAGVRLIWQVFLPTRNVWAYKPDGTAKLYRVTDTLPGEDVLPGFTVPVAELFEGLDLPTPQAPGADAPGPPQAAPPATSS